MHFQITRSSIAFLKKKVIFLCKAIDQLKELEWRHCGGERKIAQDILNPLTPGGNRTLRGGRSPFSEGVGVGVGGGEGPKGRGRSRAEG